MGGRKYSFRPYYRTRKLKSYNFDMSTYAYHHLSAGVVTRLHIKCN